MKILSIAKYVITRSMRNITVMLIMCAMPLVIIFVLGVAFDDSMGSSDGINVGEMEISYYIDGEESELTVGFEEFTNSISEEMTVTKVDDLDAELERLKRDKLTSVVLIDENNNEIKLYKNSINDTDSSLYEGMLRTYVDRYKTIMGIIKVNPIILSEIVDKDVESSDYTINKSVSTKRQPGSMDYYGISMIILFALYGALTPVFDVQYDYESGIYDRMTTSSITGSELFTGNMLGFVTNGVIQTTIVAVISYLAFDIYWGEQPIFPILTILSLIICMSSFGVFVGSTIKSESASSPFMHVFIVASAFFGGAYVPVSQMGSLGSIGKFFSLIWWANTGIQKFIYSDDASFMIYANIIFISIAVFLTIVNSIMFKKRRAR